MKKPGFKAIAKKISAKEGIPLKNAGAILASSTRKTSPTAKKANPALKKVKMSKPQNIKSLAPKGGMY